MKAETATGYRRALPWLRRAAAANDPWAKYILGYICDQTFRRSDGHAEGESVGSHCEAASSLMESVAMEAKWNQAGFFLLAESKAPEAGEQPFPENLLTVSDCIFDVYPTVWAMHESYGVEPEDVEAIRENLGLDPALFAPMQTWVDEALEAKRIGWPNVFLSAQAAAEFRQRFLGSKKVRVVGLCVAEDFVERVVNEELESGMSLLLQRRVAPTASAIPRGFDVMGMEEGAGLHSFYCNGLQADYREKLGISFNEFGLIEDYAKAVEAAEFSNRQDVGEEPVVWYPFRVDEIRTT